MKIKVLIMDVDGTLTDGKLYIGAEGEMFKAFSSKDGHGINVLLRQAGIIPVIITGRKSAIVERRCQEIRIDHVYQGIEDKKAKLEELVQVLNVKKEEIAYIGDDINDLECMKECALIGCPSDSVMLIKEIADYICERKGGDGAVREFIDYILRKDSKK